MAWRVELSRAAERQLDELDSRIRSQIIAFLYDRLAKRSDPRELGRALVGPLKGLWRYRVGDYRIVAEIRDTELVILALGIGHRKEIYH